MKIFIGSESEAKKKDFSEKKNLIKKNFFLRKKKLIGKIKSYQYHLLHYNDGSLVSDYVKKNNIFQIEKLVNFVLHTQHYKMPLTNDDDDDGDVG